MRVLVTGSSGTLGSAAWRRLVAAGHRVRCFDLTATGELKRAARRGEIEIETGDIRDPAAVARAVTDAQAIIHLAAILAPASEVDPELSAAVNVGGTRNVIAAASAVAPEALLVYPSSVTVYGRSQHLPPPRTADEPLRPVDCYSSHKAKCEDLVRMSALSWTILRIGVALAPGATRVSGGVLGTLFEVAPDNRLEYVHPDDVARAMERVLECPAARGRVLLIGGGPACRIRQRDLLDAYFFAVGLGPLPAAAFGAAPYYTDWLDTAESERLLRYQQRTFADFQRAVRRRYRFLRPFVAAIRPIARWAVLRHSGPWRERRRNPDGAA